MHSRSERFFIFGIISIDEDFGHGIHSDDEKIRLNYVKKGATMEKLLTKKEIAELLGTSHGVATSILSKYGVAPIDLGYGRGRGQRWLQSAVISAMHRMHEDAQTQSYKPYKHQTSCNTKKLHEMSVDEIALLLT